MDEKKITERSADFEERVKAGGPFRTEEFDLMTDEEFSLILPAMGPAQAAEAEKIRAMSADKRKGSGPAREINK